MTKPFPPVQASPATLERYIIASGVYYFVTNAGANYSGKFVVIEGEITPPSVGQSGGLDPLPIDAQPNVFAFYWGTAVSPRAAFFQRI